MRQRFLAAILVSTLAGPACAAGYDDFTRGLTANLYGDAATAIAAFNAALSSPDLVSAYRSAAYRSRGTTYLALYRCDEALADVQSYVTLNGLDEPITRLRMGVHLCRKDLAAARLDFDAVTKSKPSASDYMDFCRLEWLYGMFAEAAATAKLAYSATTKHDRLAAYMLLWQALSANRAGKWDPVDLAAQLDQWSFDLWPRPILEFYLGKRSEANLLDEANSRLAWKNTAQLCDANFYVAEWHLARKESAAAIPLLLAVMSKCPTTFVEYSSAQQELKRMGVPAPKE